MTTSSTPFLPDYQFSELHESKPMAFSAEAIIDAVENFDMRADWVADLLLTVREWPSRVRGWFGSTTAPEEEAFGFHKFTLLQRSVNELSLGLVGKFWRPDMGLVAISDTAAFEACSDNTVAKLVLRFQVIEKANNTCSLRTETFIYCPSRKTKLLFLPYWIAIRAASGWIRMRTLKLIQQQMSTAPGAGLPPIHL